MMKLSKIRDNGMIMISKMRDKINPRKKRLNLEEAKRKKVEKLFGPDFVSFMVGNEPTSYREALVVLLSRCKPLGSKWIFKKKMKADGTIAKHKARLVIKEFRQREGLDYFNTYSPVTRITSTRMVLAIATLRNLEVHLMDVKPTFLNKELEEEIYMNQPQGFIAPGLESKVCRLVKSLYDLRKAPKQGHQISPYQVLLEHKNQEASDSECEVRMLWDESIGIGTSLFVLDYISQANTISFESDYGCPSDMSNSDELRHTDNTTLVPPRLPDTLPQVYHRRRPTLGLLILPSVPSFSPTIRRTTRISVLPIEPNLAERARISAINLDDYQLDPLTPPPSPLSPFSMAAYQRMIAETDPTRREEALTAYGTETGQNSVPVPETALTVCTTRLRGQLHTILEDMDRYPNACLEELEAFMILWDVKPRVEERSLETLSVDELITQLRQMCEDAEDRASNAQEEARQKRKEALEEVVQQIYRNNN
ncbi:retrotransposon protein, putative, ty1-copia subclass [Tanacetum coccineum]